MSFITSILQCYFFIKDGKVDDQKKFADLVNKISCMLYIGVPTDYITNYDRVQVLHAFHAQYPVVDLAVCSSVPTFLEFESAAIAFESGYYDVIIMHNPRNHKQYTVAADVMKCVLHCIKNKFPEPDYV